MMRSSKVRYESRGDQDGNHTRDYRLILDDLLDKRAADLLLSQAGQYYQARLDKQRTAILGLPSQGDDSPFARELEDADDVHDRWGRVISLTTDICRERPAPSAEPRTLGERVRQAFIPLAGRAQ